MTDITYTYNNQEFGLQKNLCLCKKQGFFEGHPAGATEGTFLRPESESKILKLKIKKFRQGVNITILGLKRGCTGVFLAVFWRLIARLYTIKMHVYFIGFQLVIICGVCHLLPLFSLFPYEYFFRNFFILFYSANLFHATICKYFLPSVDLINYIPVFSYQFINYLGVFNLMTVNFQFFIT